MTENLPLMQLFPLKHTTTKKTNKPPQNPVVMSGDDNTVSEQ